MNEADIISRIKSIKTWKANGQRAPHKPLLILYALGQLKAGKEKLRFEDAEEPLINLLERYAPQPKSGSYRPYYPFIRLHNDGIWDVSANEPLDFKKDYSNRRLIKANAQGYFSDELRAELLSTPDLIIAIAEFLLDSNFPTTLHEDILVSVGLDLEHNYSRKRKPRDPQFRQKILEAYGRSCAVCGYQVRIDDQLIGLEAAHIKWHQAGGPDVEQNGVAMCSLHHKLFDSGLLTINEDLVLKVSRKANGGYGYKEWLLDYHNKPIRKPRSTKDYPKQEFILWQVNEVFKGEHRRQ